MTLLGNEEDSDLERIDVKSGELLPQVEGQLPLHHEEPGFQPRRRNDGRQGIFVAGSAISVTAKRLRRWNGWIGSSGTGCGLRSASSRSAVRCVAELWKRGVSKDLTARTAGSAHGPSRLANSLALVFALPNTNFDSLGIPRFSWPIAQPAEPPDADPHVRWCDRESRRQPTYMSITSVQVENAHVVDSHLIPVDAP